MDFRRAVLTALILGGAAAAFQKIKEAGPEDKPLADRYGKLVRRQLKMVGIQSKYLALAGPGVTWVPYRTPGYREDMTKQFNKLLKLLMTEFNGAEELERNYRGLLVKVRKIFYRELVIDTFDEDDLAAWENTVIAVAVMRHLLAERRMVFDPCGCKYWDEFSDVYQDVILEA